MSEALPPPTRPIYTCTTPSNLVWILLGGPGSGKGTQSALLSEALHLHHIDMGKHLRAEIAAGTPLGVQADRYMKDGNLVPMELVFAVIDHAIDVARDQRASDAPFCGFLFDGFPRNTQQSYALTQLLHQKGLQMARVLFLQTPEAVLKQRLLARQRGDDTPVIIENRFKAYHSETEPLIELFRTQGVLTEFDANQPIEVVFNAILKYVTQAPWVGGDATDGTPAIQQS